MCAVHPMSLSQNKVKEMMKKYDSVSAVFASPLVRLPFLCPVWRFQLLSGFLLPHLLLVLCIVFASSSSKRMNQSYAPRCKSSSRRIGDIFAQS